MPSLGLPCASANSSDVYHVTGENIKSTAGPAIQPIVEVDHARASNSEPTLDVMMWAAAVTQVPAQHMHHVCWYGSDIAHIEC